MNGKQVRLRLALFSLLLALFGLFLAARPAGATFDRWAIWRLQTTFPNNKLDTQLIVLVGHTTQNGHRVIDQVDSFPVACLPVGNPLIIGGKAIFNGSSYFQCSVPSIKQKVGEMTNGTLIIADVCNSKRPFVTATASINTTPLQTNPENPLFYRQPINQNTDIAFRLPLQGTTQQASMVVLFGQTAAESSMFTAQPNQTLTAIYQRISPTIFAPVFTANTTSLIPTPATVNPPFRLSALESTAYIGYSPSSGQYFEGSLSSLLVDPHCEGKG